MNFLDLCRYLIVIKMLRSDPQKGMHMQVAMLRLALQSGKTPARIFESATFSNSTFVLLKIKTLLLCFLILLFYLSCRRTLTLLNMFFLFCIFFYYVHSWLANQWVFGVWFSGRAEPLLDFACIVWNSLIMQFFEIPCSYNANLITLLTIAQQLWLVSLCLM